LRDEKRSMSAMPRKRRLAVKAPPVAMGQELSFLSLRKRSHEPLDALGAGSPHGCWRALLYGALLAQVEVANSATDRPVKDRKL